VKDNQGGTINDRSLHKSQEVPITANKIQPEYTLRRCLCCVVVPEEYTGAYCTFSWRKVACLDGSIESSFA
jgi:hypothetical protein